MRIHSHSSNNFDFLRIIAALLVFYSHSFAIMGLTEPTILNSYNGYQEITLGAFGVTIFFTISGFLIAASYRTSTSVKAFFVKRFARIYPGYWGNMLFVILILGTFVSSLNTQEYFSELGKSAFDILGCVPGIFNFCIPDLPGVFNNNIVPNAVNGPLWTLLPELICYVSVAIFGAFKLKDRRFVLGLCVLLLLLNFFKHPHSIIALTWLHFCSFALGALISIYCDRLKIRYRYIFISFMALMLIKIFTIYIIPFYLIFAAYTVIAFSLINGRFAFISRYGDFSYGIYLYSWPVQQTFAEYYKFDKSMFVPYFIFSLIVVVALSVISWKLIEGPALNKIRNKLKKTNEV